MPIDSHLPQADPFSLVPTFKAPQNRFQGTNSGQNDIPIPTRFLLAPIDYLKTPAQLISNGDRFELAFVKTNKKQTMIDLRCPRNLKKLVLKPVMSLHKAF
jgi:hypothetical protein